MITRGDGHRMEVFLGERSPELRFFGGYQALPGGTVDDEDRDASGPEGDDDGPALQACARRELFEETGLLWERLPPQHATRDELVALVTRLVARDRRVGAGAERADIGPRWATLAAALQGAPLEVLCRIETPPFAPVRYDTVFFHVPLEHCTAGTSGPRPDGWGGELVQGRFWLPTQALASWRNGALRLVPPVTILLEQLAEHRDLDRFAAEIEKTAAGYRKGRMHQERFSPGIVLAPLKTPTLPPATTTNCYVVGTDRLWVVDPGSPHADEQRRLEGLLDELTQNGASVGSNKDISSNQVCDLFAPDHHRYDLIVSQYSRFGRLRRLEA
jgi:8-oxo-dGTP pyrophosphatase MutT (NUDIX family)